MWGHPLWGRRGGRHWLGLLGGVESGQGVLIPVECLGLWLGGSEESMEGLHQVSTVGEKTVVKIHESSELM